MHPNPLFHRPPADALAFARKRGFGALVVGLDGIVHLPFVLDEDGVTARLHVSAKNPVLDQLPCAAVLVVSGPDVYVSPTSYGVPDQVPTWNYVAVHLSGRLERVDTLEEDLAVLVEQVEANQPDPWSMDQLSQPRKAGLLRGIVGLRFTVAQARMTEKMSQNKPVEMAQRAADAAESAVGMEVSQAAARMRKRRSRGPSI